MKTASTLIPVLLVCLCLAGCAQLQNHWQRLFSDRNAPPPLNPPPAGAALPTLEQLTSAINRNSQNIRNLTTENASIHMSGVWVPLHTRLTFERPKRLRIQGFATTLTGQEFDFGSNDDIFWIWARRGMGEVWYFRHDLYPYSPVRSAFPIDPEWLIEALGIVEFKLTDQHIGPNRLPDGNWEIISYRQTPAGLFVKRTVIDSRNGWVVLQELRTPQNELIASAESSDWQIDRGTGIFYARQITVQSQAMEGRMTINLGSPTFNTAVPFAETMFVMPVFEGFRAVDLTSPEFMQQRGVIMPTQMPTTIGPVVSPAVPQANIQTVIR